VQARLGNAALLSKKDSVGLHEMQKEGGTMSAYFFSMNGKVYGGFESVCSSW
jgi:hypothetical protein